MGAENPVIDIQILNMEDHGSNVLVNYYQFFSPKPIKIAICLGKVYLGIFKTDCRILFIVRLNDGSAQLIQVKEGSSECLKLLQLSEDTLNGVAQAFAPSVKGPPYQLGKNELPQGSYLIGRDIPAGTYDFYVVYGTGGKMDLGKYDADGKRIDGTWNFYWVGLKEEYEKRELVHILCREGDTVKISGNVILRIAKSQQVQIDL